MEVNSSASDRSQIGFPTLKIHPVTLQVVFHYFSPWSGHMEENLLGFSQTFLAGVWLFMQK